jgi:hypothetical protein
MASEQAAVPSLICAEIQKGNRYRSGAFDIE